MFTLASINSRMSQRKAVYLPEGWFFTCLRGASNDLIEIL